MDTSVPQPDFNNTHQESAILTNVSSYDGPAELFVTTVQDLGTSISRSRTSSFSSQTSEASLFGPLPTPSRYQTLPSDIESEVDDSGIAASTVSKEDLYRYYRKMEHRSDRYKAKFVQVVSSFKEVEKERDKLRVCIGY